MKRVLRNVLALAGLLLIVASFVWMQLHRTERQRAGPQPRTTSPSAASKPFAVVVLDPGHGGQDSGAMCGGMMEKDLTLDVAHRIERRLHEAGLQTLMTRDGDSYVSLADRAAMTNRARDCIFISIHFNEGNKPVSTGIETYYAEHQVTVGTFLASWLPFLQRISSDASNLRSQSLAGFIQEALVTHTHAVNRGTKTEQFFVLANVHHPAVLV